jgi:hypothetical protein
LCLCRAVWVFITPPSSAFSQTGELMRSTPCSEVFQITADQIVMPERAALDRWVQGHPSGSLELYAVDITYFDPVTAPRIDGHQAMVNYNRSWIGKIRIATRCFPLLNGRAH